jgi:hypothetical protein
LSKVQFFLEKKDFLPFVCGSDVVNKLPLLPSIEGFKKLFRKYFEKSGLIQSVRVAEQSLKRCKKELKNKTKNFNDNKVAKEMTFKNCLLSFFFLRNPIKEKSHQYDNLQ